MAWCEAIDDLDGGCALLLEATPGAKRSAFPSGWNAWRGRIGIVVRAAAQDGKANQEVCQVVAAFFQVPPAAVTLLSGASDRRKRVHVAGISADQARLRMEGLL